MEHVTTVEPLPTGDESSQFSTPHRHQRESRRLLHLSSSVEDGVKNLSDKCTFESLTNDYFEYEQGVANIRVRGRLKQNIGFWRNIGASGFVLDVIENGYKISFYTTPPPMNLPNNKSASENSVFVTGAIIRSDSFNKKKEDYIIISPTVGSKSQLNDGGTFEINSLSNWLLLSDAYFRCDFKIKDGTPNENRVPQTNTTLENNFFPSSFSEMVLEAGSNPIETIKHPGEFDTMLKTVLYPKDFDSVLGWIPDVGDGSVLKEPVRNLANDADLARVRVVARNTIEREARAANHGFEKRVLQYNNVVENNKWGNYVNWKLYPLFGLLEHRKVSIGLPYKIHLQREINDDKIFFGENGSDAKLEITNLQLYIPVITPSIEVEPRIFNSLTKDIEIAFLHRNTVGSMTLTGESTTWPITNTIKPARYLMVGFKN
ncbi:hypothetical protein LOTGIDRAFT_157621 [Lottia gigantea]|uniref:Uncharacterized protein n=1 Tax=Lottia gigantea TaxID=225164 RepID=V4B5U5_LOTGI|nr:hypothetical protein LOTGIDRAFT_157621 [Lottia gigantea]ESP01437.1 hypothetical protein LOTGIDRAFT_157621 [Lottia gigantea]